MLHTSLEAENHVSVELMNKIKLLTKDTVLRSILLLLSLPKLRLKSLYFLYFPVHGFLWVLLSSVEALTPVHCMLTATLSAQFPGLDQE